MRIGVLALQGGFAEHIGALQKLGVDSFEIRKKADLNGDIDGLILPGGESTVIGRLLYQTALTYIATPTGGSSAASRRQGRFLASVRFQ